jgi:hypothetical protein
LSRAFCCRISMGVVVSCKAPLTSQMILIGTCTSRRRSSRRCCCTDCSPSIRHRCSGQQQKQHPNPHHHHHHPQPQQASSRRCPKYKSCCCCCCLHHHPFATKNNIAAMVAPTTTAAQIFLHGWSLVCVSCVSLPTRSHARTHTLNKQRRLSMQVTLCLVKSAKPLFNNKFKVRTVNGNRSFSLAHNHTHTQAPHTNTLSLSLSDEDCKTRPIQTTIRRVAAQQQLAFILVPLMRHYPHPDTTHTHTRQLFSLPLRHERTHPATAIRDWNHWDTEQPNLSSSA